MVADGLRGTHYGAPTSHVHVVGCLLCVGTWQILDLSNNQIDEDAMALVPKLAGEGIAPITLHNSAQSRWFREGR